MIKDLTKEDFNSEVIESKGVVLVDFWAPWCGPCKMLAPLFEELDSEMDDVKFVKVNVDKNVSLAREYKVQSIPTLVAFKDGVATGQLSGFRPKEELVSFINSNK